MSNPDNQPGREDRTKYCNRTPDDRGLDNRKAGMGTVTKTVTVAAAVIVGALWFFGRWSVDHNTGVSYSTPATTNSAPGTTTGQTSGTPRVITPNVPASPSTTAQAPATR